MPLHSPRIQQRQLVERRRNGGEICRVIHRRKPTAQFDCDQAASCTNAPLAQPIIFSLMWLLLKAFKRLSSSARWPGWYVELSDDWEPLSTVLAHLEWKVEEKLDGSPSRRASDDTTLDVVATPDVPKGAASFLTRNLLARAARALRRSADRELSVSEVEVREITELSQHR